ncbi:MAG TPA: hypothetical protein VMA34_15590 [Terracidiphilus sp.]|nr:hypothetical protein [Terracidiphilus sp.]
MTRPEFEDLPFDKRPDLTPYLVHLTRNSEAEDDRSAFENLVRILKSGKIRGSTDKGFIKGPTPAACLMDVPFASLKYVFGDRNIGKNGPRYEPFGVFFSKKYGYKKGCRPVLYLSDEELENLEIPDKEKWRVVRFEVGEEGWISWLHEREWRCPNGLKLPSSPYGVLVRRASDARRLGRLIENSPDKFAVKPRSIIPLEVICQGLLK